MDIDGGRRKGCVYDVRGSDIPGLEVLAGQGDERERERESQDCIPYLETNLTNRKRRTVDKTCTQCVHLTRHTNWVRLQCTYPRHLRTRGVGWIGRRKGCVGERERERVSCECTWWVDFREKEQIGCR